MPEAGNYTMISAGDRTLGGYPKPMPGAPERAHWLSHLLARDARAQAKQVTSLGGKVLAAPVDMLGYGTMAVVADPHGGAFALWQPSKPEPAPAPATHTFCWNELASADPERSVAFYRAIGGFTEQRMEMAGWGTYHVLEADGAPRAGITKQVMPGQPHAWLPYVQVASADRSADKAKQLGATILVPPTDIPGVGRFALFADPQGAPLGLLQLASR